MKVALTICTRARPQLLRACLESVSRQRVPDGVALSVIVVENDTERHIAPLLEEIGAAAPFPLQYFHEPELGIPFARNRAVELALAQQADWIGFIDDDEELLPGWLDTMAAILATTEADVITGPVEEEYVCGRPDWLGSPKADRIATGTPQGSAATNNTLARAQLFCADGLALRFDEELRFSGGSDVELFGRAARAGASILWHSELRVREVWPEGRARMGWHLARAYRVAIGEARGVLSAGGGWNAVRVAGGRTASRVAGGLVNLAVCAPLMIVSRKKARRALFKGLMKFAQAAGTVGGCLGHRVEPYRKVGF